MLDKMKNEASKSPSEVTAEATPLLDHAFVVLNDTQLTFEQKFKQIEKLDKQTKGLEQELFGDIFSALYNIAETEADFKLISGSD